MAEPQPYSPAYPGTPVGAPQPVNLRDLGPILALIIKNASLRADMLADPATTLTRLNYIAHAEVVAFFKSLDAANFDAAAKAFAPAHPDPSLGMAEI